MQYYYDTPLTTFRQVDSDGAVPRTDLGWRISPEGLYHAVTDVWNRYKVPILMTENGIADDRDIQRGRFILDHLAWLARAIDDGADVRGYLHWAMTDNFEWAYGFWPRFGLAAVDYETCDRTLRPSARLYGEIARGNRITPAMGEGLTYVDGTPTLGPPRRAGGSGNTGR